MKRTAFLRFLTERGASFEDGGDHTIVRLGDKRSIIGRRRGLRWTYVRATCEHLGVDPPDER